MRPEDFRPDDLFAQIQGLVDGLSAERRAREAAEAADKAKSELLAMVGHELRSPMEAITAMGELLLASPLDPTQERYASMLHQSARSLLGVLGTLLTGAATLPLPIWIELAFNTTGFIIFKDLCKSLTISHDINHPVLLSLLLLKRKIKKFYIIIDLSLKI